MTVSQARASGTEHASTLSTATLVNAWNPSGGITAIYFHARQSLVIMVAFAAMTSALTRR